MKLFDDPDEARKVWAVREAGLGATAFMLIFIIPTFAKMFSDFGGELPLPTKIVLGLSTALKMFWWVGVLAIIIGIAGIFSVSGSQDTSTTDTTEAASPRSVRFCVRSPSGASTISMSNSPNIVMMLPNWSEETTSAGRVLFSSS